MRKFSLIAAIIFLILACVLLPSFAFAAGITVDSGASVTLSGSPAITTVDLNNSGTVTADAGTINIGGSWTNTGTFNSGTSTLGVVGTGASTINGTNTFYNFSCITASKQINFSSAQTQTISHNFTLTGASGSRISLRPTSDGTQWNLNPQGTVAVSFVDVKDSNNTNSSVISPSNSLDSGNNSGWVFGSLAFTSAAQSLLTGVESDPFNFSINYANSNLAQRDISIGLASDSLGPFQFRASSGGSSVSSVTVPNGLTTGNFFYRDEHTGSPTLTISSRGYTSGSQQTSVSGAVFTLTAASPQVAGSNFTLTITAKDSSGNTLTSYSGTVNLTVGYISPVSGSGALGVTTVNNFVNGIATISNQTFSDCGTITITATDSGQASASGTSADINFRPYDFAVTTSGLDTAVSTGSDGRQAVNKQFSLAVTARNASGGTCPNYTGNAALSINYISPAAAQNGSLAVSSLDSTNFSNGSASISTQTYSKCGTITITATDTTLSTQKGTSGNIIFIPQDFLIALSAPPPARNFYYTGENFSATVTVRDFNAAAISNYTGTVTFKGNGLSLPSDYAFTGSDSGNHIFSAINGSSDVSTSFSVNDTIYTAVSGASQNITIKSATINIASTSGPVGALNIQVRILDSNGNLITSDNSSTFTITVTESVKNDTVVSKAAESKVTVSGGTALVTISDTEAETVTVTASSAPVLTPVSGIVRFGTTSGGGVGIQFWREIGGVTRGKEAEEE